MSAQALTFISLLSTKSQEDVAASTRLIMEESSGLANLATLVGFSRGLVDLLRCESDRAQDRAHRAACAISSCFNNFPLFITTSQKRFSTAFDMVSLGLSDERDPGAGTVEACRFSEFFSCPYISRIQLINDIFSWGGGSWYLARAYGTYTQAGEALANLFLALADQPACCYPDAVPAYGNLAEWLIERQYRPDDYLRSQNRSKLALRLRPHRLSSGCMRRSIQGRIGQKIGFDRARAADLARTHLSAQVRCQVSVQDFLLGSGKLDRVITETRDFGTN